MKEKVYQCCKKLNDTKTWKRIVPFLYLVLIIIFSIFAYKNHSFYYPEKEYQVLEEEAYRLAIQNEFCLELETDYKCIIDYYNIDSNDVTFRLIDSEYKLYGTSNKYIQPAPISISVSVDNCKATDREIKEIKRMEKKCKWTYRKRNISNYRSSHLFNRDVREYSSAYNTIIYPVLRI